MPVKIVIDNKEDVLNLVFLCDCCQDVIENVDDGTASCAWNKAEDEIPITDLRFHHKKCEIEFRRQFSPLLYNYSMSIRHFKENLLDYLKLNLNV